MFLVFPVPMNYDINRMVEFDRRQANQTQRQIMGEYQKFPLPRGNARKSDTVDAVGNVVAAFAGQPAWKVLLLKLALSGCRTPNEVSRELRHQAPWLDI